MTFSDAAPAVIPALIFCAVATAVFVLGQFYATQAHTQRRLPGSSNESSQIQKILGLHAFITRRFDEKRFRLSATRRDQLRRQLLKAGYFDQSAISFYIFLRLAAMVVVPVVAYLLSQALLAGAPAIVRIVFIAVSVLIAIAGPDAYLARRQRILSRRYRLVFPDLLDLLVVCVDAGLGLEAAFDRVTAEIVKQSRDLGINLQMMGAEMRAGRSLIQALQSLADRLNLSEAESLTTMLRQSIELGVDVADALRVFSDEMRDKRLLRAEETANKLSVKMVLPLGLFIFPVVLLVIMLPVTIKLLAVMQ